MRHNGCLWGMLVLVVGLSCNASAAVWYVNAANSSGTEDGLSWDTAFTTIQQGVDAASNALGGEVWVAAGGYSSPTSPVVRLRSNVELYGGFNGTETDRSQRDPGSNTVVIDASGAPAPSRGVNMNNLTGARLDGFTIVNGDANGTAFPQDSGGGILCWNADSSNTIANTTLFANHAYNGGAIRCHRAAPVIENCIVGLNSADNQGGAIMIAFAESTPHITGLTFALNSAPLGGAVFAYSGAAPVFDHCMLVSNTASESGGAFNFDTNVAATLTACTISGNQASNNNGGALVCSRGSDVTVINSVITGNSAHNVGGALYASLSAPSMINCTVVGNQAGRGGGLACKLNANVVLTNTLFRNNPAYAVYELDTTSDPVITNCLFQNNSSGDYLDENTTPLTGAAAINALPGNSGSVTGEPSFVMSGPQGITGTWISPPVYSPDEFLTYLEAAPGTFEPDAITGSVINVDLSQRLQHFIAGNTDSLVVVFGDVTSIAQQGDTFKVANYRLSSGSAAIDVGAATGAPSTDLDGNPRPVDVPGQGADGTGTEYDIGAYEVQSSGGVPPTVTLSCSDPDPTHAAITVTATLSEPSVTFTSSSLTLTNASVDSFTGSGASYTVVLSAVDQGVVSCVVNAGAFTSLAGLANVAPSNTVERTFDSIAPTAAMDSATSDPTNVSPIPIRVLFSEPVADFTVSDVTATTGTITNFAGSGTAYTFDLVVTSQGLVTVTVPDGAAHDSAGNGNALATLSRTLDTVAPTPVISGATTLTNSARTLTIDFGETVSDFTSSGVSVINGSVVDVQPGGLASSFTASILGSGQATVSVTIPAGVALDTAGNANAASTAFEYPFDGVPPNPVITLAGSSPSTADSVAFNVHFNEDLAEPLGPSGVILTPGSLAGSIALAGSPPNYTATVTLDDPDADGTVGITIPADMVSDEATNTNAETVSPLYTIHNWHGFTLQPLGAQLYTGEDWALYVDANYGPIVPTFRWKWDDGLKTVHDGPTTASWVLTNVTPARNGVYSCVVTYDGVQHVSDAAELYIEDHLAITIPPEGGREPLEGSHTFFIQTTGGFQPLTYFWKKDGVTIPGATESSYTRSDLTNEDAGVYTVEVTDDNSDTVTASAELVVGAPVPVAGVAGTLALAGILALYGVARNRKR